MTFMTEFVWTASLQAIHNFIVLRNAPDSQREIRELADKMDQMAMDKFPLAYSSLEEHA